MHDALTIRWMTTSPATPHPDDLRLFLTVVRRGGFSAAATELGLSTAKSFGVVVLNGGLQFLLSPLMGALSGRLSRYASSW